MIYLFFIFGVLMPLSTIFQLYHVLVVEEAGGSMS
jgi:hypothetical protein